MSLSATIDLHPKCEILSLLVALKLHYIGAWASYLGG